MFTNKFYLFCFAFIATGFTARSQTLFSNGGNSNDVVTYSIGEPFIGYVNNPSNQITVGFHQTKLLVTGLEESEFQKPIMVFPNPTTSELYVQIENNAEPLQINILNAEGKIIAQQNMETDLTQISFEPMEAGIYFIQIIDKQTNSFKTHKIIKTK